MEGIHIERPIKNTRKATGCFPNTSLKYYCYISHLISRVLRTGRTLI
jgi:hypothetical protein